jgi:hypothetical protein
MVIKQRLMSNAVERRHHLGETRRAQSRAVRSPHLLRSCGEHSLDLQFRVTPHPVYATRTTLIGFVGSLFRLLSREPLGSCNACPSTPSAPDDTPRGCVGGVVLGRDLDQFQENVTGKLESSDASDLTAKTWCG